MELADANIGFALTGSFCTLKQVIEQMKKLKETGANIIPIMSEIVFCTDTRFGKAADFIWEVEEICKNKVIATIKDAEPIGPKKMLDLLIVAPCTGNTLAKLAYGVLFVSTNDGLGAAAKNIGMLFNYKNIYFTPFGQDDHINKPNSLVAKCDMLIPSVEFALIGKQIQPVLM